MSEVPLRPKVTLVTGGARSQTAAITQHELYPTRESTTQKH
jgi:hypothetical protein